MIWAKRFAIFVIIGLTLIMWFKKNNPNISAEFTLEKSLIQRLSAPIFSIAKSAPNAALRNVLLKVDANVIKFIVSDGRRILVMQGKIESLNTSKFSIIVPYEAIEQLAAIDLSRGYRTGRVSINNQEISFKFDSTDFTKKYLDIDKLPEYEKLIPASSDAKVIVNKEKMHDVLRESASLADSDHRIKVEIGNNKMIFSSPISQSVDSKTIDANYTGNTLTMFFNIDYIMEFLNDVAIEDSIVLDFPALQGVPQGCLVAKGEDYVFVLLPMAPR